MLFKLDFFSKWKPSAEEFTAPLARPLPFRARLDGFPRGIDNVHIDVILSPRLVEATRLLLRLMIQHEVNESLSNKQAVEPPPSARDIAQFQNAYEGMMETVVGIARKAPSRELLQLAEFAAMQFLFASIGEESEKIRDELQQQRDYGRLQSKRAVQLHEQLVALARELPAIRRRVAQQLMAHVQKVEASVSLRMLRKSLLGYSWPVPRDVVFNPVLQLPSLWAGEQLMRHYPLVGVNPERLQEFAVVNRVITGLFADYLPEWTQASASSGKDSDLDGGRPQLRLRTDQGTLTGFLDVELLLSRALREEEYQRGKTSWLDDPANLEQVLRAPIAATPDNMHKIAFQARLLKDAEADFKAQGLLKKIYAAQAAPAIFDQLQGQMPVRLIVDYLEGGISQGKMAKRLAGTKGAADAEAVLRSLEAGKSVLRRLSPSKQRQYLIDFMVGFATLRRDLKLAYRAYWNMNQIRVLKEPAHIALARSNRTLHEFVLPQERPSDQLEIKSHAILKADLRGSSRITRELRERKLNPATHFSLNFFDPITKLLERFGAKKVFVEGDAVILSLYEYQETPQDWLAISRAAGLARDILGVVDAQNAQNRKHGLPELELGMGIAWLGEAPAFLYDGEHEIMISSAINRSDRLSSCAASLRTTVIGETLPRGVEVVMPVGQGIMQKDSGDKLLRYNVNGIELDPAAFPKLRSELVLREVSLALPQYDPRSVFYVGSYPDKQGVMQWLVVREAPIRLWIGDEIISEESGERKFYEIITDPELIATLKAEAEASAGSLLLQQVG